MPIPPENPERGVPADPAPGSLESDASDVAVILERLRAGVRQRRAESVTLGEGSESTRNGLLALRAREYVQEPIVVSHRARFGRAIVFVRKAFFHLFLKPFFRPLLEQQNAFNETASRLIQELAEGAERQAKEIRELRARLAELDPPREAVAPAGGEPPSR
jgi:hypothetical protein